MGNPLPFLLGVGLPLLAGVVASGPRQEKAGPATESNRPGVYGCDPAHPGEVVHRALLVRRGPDGKEYGVDELDPLLWPQSRYLLEEPASSTALAALDRFLSSNAERILPDGIKRVVFQRDLWAVFDWLA